MEEREHVIQVITRVRQALRNEDATTLRILSDTTIHSASLVQDAGSLTLAVLVYALSKLIERSDQHRIKKWGKFLKKFDTFTDLAVKALRENRTDLYEYYLQSARQSITATAVNLKPYIAEVMRKASVNKASKIYEHGISMGQTAKLLGVTQWELSEYTGQKHFVDTPYNETLDIKKRAQMALEFFA